MTSSVLLVIAAGVAAAQVAASPAAASPSSVVRASGITGHQDVQRSTAVEQRDRPVAPGRFHRVQPVVGAVPPGIGASTSTDGTVVARRFKGTLSRSQWSCLLIGIGLATGVVLWVARLEREGRIRPRDPAELFGSDDPVDPADPVESADPTDEPPGK